MNAEEIRTYCLSKKEVEESFPFGEQTLVFKVVDKIFALLALNADPLSINLKCDPEKAIEFREQHPAVEPGYHMNKRHWNTVTIDGSVSKELLSGWIDHSYELVVAQLPKAEREKLVGE